MTQPTELLALYPGSLKGSFLLSLGLMQSWLPSFYILYGPEQDYYVNESKVKQYVC